MCEYEFGVMRLMDAHDRARKSDLIKNINEAITNKGISWNGKNQWVSEVTGSPIGTICTWFSYAKCRASNKIPLYAMCQIAVALEISVWDLLKAEDGVQTEEKPKIDRKCRLYWHIRRNEAEDIWNASYALEKGTWVEQDREVQREFLDRLYLERLKEGRKDNG